MSVKNVDVNTLTSLLFFLENYIFLGIKKKSSNSIIFKMSAIENNLMISLTLIIRSPTANLPSRSASPPGQILVTNRPWSFFKCSVNSPPEIVNPNPFALFSNVMSLTNGGCNRFIVYITESTLKYIPFSDAIMPRITSISVL